MISQQSLTPQQTHVQVQVCGTSLYKLMQDTKRPACVVAYGRVVGDLPDNPGCYKIILDEIIKGSVNFGPTRNGKMEDLMRRDVTERPKWKTIFY